MENDLKTLKKHLLNHGIVFGQHSPSRRASFMVDTRQALLKGSVLNLAGKLLWKRIKKYDPEVLYGGGYGSINVMLAIKVQAELEGYSLDVIVCRDRRKDRNRRRRIEGPDTRINARAVYVDDLMNHGNGFRSIQREILGEGRILNTVAVALVFDFWTWSGTRRLEVTGTPIIRLFRRHDLGYTREDDHCDPVTDSVLWRNFSNNQWWDIGSKTRPSIIGDRVYFGTDRHEVFCHDLHSGEIIWRWQGPQPLHKKGLGAGFKFNNNFIYITSYDGSISVLNCHTGQLQWRRHLDMYMHGMPCIDNDRSRMYLSTEGGIQNQRGDVICLDLTTGTTLWRTPTQHVIPCSPNIINDLVISGSNDHHLYALDPNSGEPRWILTHIGEVKGCTNQIGTTLIASTEQGWLYGIDTDYGNIKWKRPCGTRSHHQYLPVHKKLGLTYVINEDGLVIAYNGNGDQIWLRRLRAGGSWNITLRGDELMVITKQGHISILDAETGEKIKNNKLNHKVGCPPDFDDNYVAVNTVSDGFFLYKRAK